MLLISSTSKNLISSYLPVRETFVYLFLLPRPPSPFILFFVFVFVRRLQLLRVRLWLVLKMTCVQSN